MNKEKTYAPVNIKKRALAVVCVCVACALIGLILSAFIVKKDVKSTAEIGLEIKDQTALVSKAADAEKSISLFREASGEIGDEVTVKQLRRNVSFTDDDVSARDIVRNVRTASDKSGNLSVSMTIAEPNASVLIENATTETDRDGNLVLSFSIGNVNPKVVISAAADSADTALSMANTVAKRLAIELYGEELIALAASEEGSTEADNSLYKIGEGKLVKTDEQVWPSVWAWTALFALLGLIIAFIACFALPAMRKQFMLNGWQKLAIVVLCTAIVGFSAYIFCEKVAKPRYIDTLTTTLEVDEAGEKALLAAKGEEFGEKDYNILNAYTQTIGSTVRADRSDFYMGVYMQLVKVDENIERPRNGLQAAINQNVDATTGAVIFTISADNDEKAERIAISSVNQLAVLMFGEPQEGKITDDDSLVKLVDTDGDALSLYEFYVNGQPATDEQIEASVYKIAEDETAKAAGNVQWVGVLNVSEENVIRQLPSADTVKFYGQTLDLYDGVGTILASDGVYTLVSEDMKRDGYTFTASELKDMVELSTSASNRSLRISVTHEDAEAAAVAATSIAKRVTESMFEGIEYGAEMYATISEPSITQSQVLVWPATITWVIVAVLASLLISYAIFAQQSAFDTVIIVFFVLFTILCVFPFYYLFINTISDNELVAGGRINFFPRGLHITNYLRIFKEDDVGQALKITVLRTIIGTGLMVFTSAWAGYLVTKQKMWKRSLWYRALVVTMYFNAGLIPWYTNMLMLGLTNNFLAYLIPGMVAPYNIILVKTYIESIPGSLEESAIIDGASTTKVFMRIILPLSIPILATIAIFGAVGNWNSFQDSLLLMSSSPSLYTLQHRLYIYLNQTTSINTEQLTTQQAESLLNTGVTTKYTIAMVTIIPILLVYPFMQRYFVKGIMLGAVKG